MRLAALAALGVVDRSGIGGDRARPRSTAVGSCRPTVRAGPAPLLPALRVRVDRGEQERDLSGCCVEKIGSAYWFCQVKQPWKYFVLYVDHRGPMNSGMNGSSSRKIFWSCVRDLLLLLAGRASPFHWSRSGRGLRLAKCARSCRSAARPAPDGTTCVRVEVRVEVPVRRRVAAPFCQSRRRRSSSLIALSGTSAPVAARA